MLNAEEWRRFTATLGNPPELDYVLQVAWRDYQDAWLDSYASQALRTHLARV